MDNSEERVHKDTLHDSSNNPSESTTVDPSTEPTYSELSIEERFIELSTITPIEYLDNHETVINGLLISIKNAILSFTMVMTMSFSTILNNLINTDFGKSIVEKAINKILMYERGIYRIKEQFDTNLNCPPFNTESFRPTIDTIIKIHDTKLKEYVDKLEDKTD